MHFVQESCLEISLYFICKQYRFGWLRKFCKQTAVQHLIERTIVLFIHDCSVRTSKLLDLHVVKKNIGGNSWHFVSLHLHLIVLFVFLCLLVLSLMCLSCHASIQPRHCHSISYCADDEVSSYVYGGMNKFWIMITTTVLNNSKSITFDPKMHL